MENFDLISNLDLYNRKKNAHLSDICISFLSLVEHAFYREISDAFRAICVSHQDNQDIKEHGNAVVRHNHYE